MPDFGVGNQGVTSSFAANLALRAKTRIYADNSRFMRINFIRINPLKSVSIRVFVRSAKFARLACLIHAASVHPGPGSNPHFRDSEQLKKFPSKLNLPF